MGVDRVAFLLMAFATHGAIGYALVSTVTGADPRIGALLAIFPDVDFLFPLGWGALFVHGEKGVAVKSVGPSGSASTPQ